MTTLGSVAQWPAQPALTRKVAGASPAGTTSLGAREPAYTCRSEGCLAGVAFCWADQPSWTGFFVYILRSTRHDRRVKCPFCHHDVEQERAELGLEVCLTCAKAGKGQARRYGVLTYEHKTGGEVQLMTGERRFKAFKALVRCQGRGGGFNSSAGSFANKAAAEKLTGDDDDRVPSGNDFGTRNLVTKMENRRFEAEKRRGVTDQIP